MNKNIYEGGESMKKKKIYIFLLLLLFVGVVSICIGGTYAKYTSKISKNSMVAIAKWNFKSDNNQTININLKENYDESTLVSTRNSSGMEYKLIAPGTEGSFDIKLVNTSEVAANFYVSIDEISNLPANIKFYKDENYQTELIPGNSKITGSLKANDSTGLNVKIYWKWPYETGTNNNGEYSGDIIDTKVENGDIILTVPITIKGVQAMPSSTPITTHID